MEDYLKKILKLEKSDGIASTGMIANELGVTAASATDMIKKLSTRKLVNYRPYKGVTLTPKGRELALKVLRRHRLVELFLHTVLKLPWEKVHQEAEIWEHFISADVEKSIDKLMGFPKIDPHGAPIPSQSGNIRKIKQILLSELKTGNRAIVSEVPDDDPELLKYLSKVGLKPGIKILIKQKIEYDDIIILKVGKTEISVGDKTAKGVYVKIL